MYSIKSADRMELGVSVASILFGLFLLADSFTIKLGSGYDHIGPRFFPFVISIGLLVTGFVMLLEVLAGISRREAERINLSAFGILIFGLVICLLLLKPAGFVIACSIQFWLIARAFSAADGLRNAITAVVLSISVYFIFTRGLGLVLPRGILAGLF